MCIINSLHALDSLCVHDSQQFSILCVLDSLCGLQTRLMDEKTMSLLDENTRYCPPPLRSGRSSPTPSQIRSVVTSDLSGFTLPSSLPLACSSGQCNTHSFGGLAPFAHTGILPIDRNSALCHPSTDTPIPIPDSRSRLNRPLCLNSLCCCSESVMISRPPPPVSLHGAFLSFLTLLCCTCKLATDGACMAISLIASARISTPTIILSPIATLN